MSRVYVVFSFIAALVIFCGSLPALADEKPVQLSLFNPIQVFPEEDSIKGIRLNLIYGRNAAVTGIDWGLINHTTTGISKAWQLGIVGFVESDFTGLQDNAANVVKGSFKGLQIGFVNYAASARGLQFGFVNYAQTTYGVQIGLINIIKQDGMFPFFPIVNWSF